MREIRLLLRAKRFAQRPPSLSRVYLFFGVLAVALGIFAVERWVGWPDWATREPASRNDIFR